MTLLTIINNVQDLVGLPRSNIVVSSTDQNVRTLLALSNREGRLLSRRYGWQAIKKEQTFTGVAADIQTNAIPSDFDHIVNATAFNRTQTRKLTGPLNDKEWQQQKSIVSSVLTDSFRIRGDDFLITPTASTSDTYTYEYISKNWCQSSGGTGQSAWAADADTGVLDEDLMEMGLLWRMLSKSSLEYAEEFRDYELEVNSAMMRDGGKRSLNFSIDDTLLDRVPIPVAPEGSWSI